MIRLSTLLSRSAAAVMLASLLVLAGCHRGATKDEAIKTAQMQGQFDATVQAYKSGQFVVDGAVLSRSGVYILVNEHRRKRRNKVLKQKTRFRQVLGSVTPF